jgi:hypothetical protein
MSGLQRYSGNPAEPMNKDDNGAWVVWLEAEEALRQAEQRGRDSYEAELVADSWRKGYEQGQRDALAAAVQRVEALTGRVVSWPAPYGQAWLAPSKDDVIAAIKGDQ